MTARGKKWLTILTMVSIVVKEEVTVNGNMVKSKIFTIVLPTGKMVKSKILTIILPVKW